MVNWEDGVLVTPAKVNEDGTIKPAVYSGKTPVSAYLLNKMQSDLQEETDNLEPHKYTLTISKATTAGAEITLPCYYKVGADVLDVYLGGERLLKSSDEEGTDGHYQEVGEIGSISNKIRATNDWMGDLVEGDILEIVVRGEYSNDTDD